MSRESSKHQDAGLFKRLLSKLGLANGRSGGRDGAQINYELNWEMSAMEALRVSTLGYASPAATSKLVSSQSETLKPAAHSDMPTSQPVMSPAKQAVKPDAQSVMVVDASDNLHATLDKLFEHMGVRLVSARSGAEAQRLINTIKPALILVDAALPDMEWARLATWIRRNEQLTESPIVLMAEDDRELEHVSHPWLEINDFLLKPFNLYGLQDMLSKYCRLSANVAKPAVRGVLGLVVDDDEQRLVLRRFLSRKGYHVPVSCSPDARECCLLLNGSKEVTSWLVQIQDEDKCIEVVSEFDSLYDAPVLVGLEMAPDSSQTGKERGNWESRLLDKLSKVAAKDELDAA
ncbi:response regulator [Hahella aquimaris]|uniref:response regulator n=1 Tax=Hahella sp. HNIBRBA332 TaxID=3015983 RepID=UPI00273CC221|nr:response regulator [Hahella sp. HNIBRBA332]WLQ12786.1 response regulator [Hahella sp. HNIBRBA332]